MLVMIVLGRRSWLLSGLTGLTGGLLLNRSDDNRDTVAADLSTFICSSTPVAFRQAIQSSGGHFLYRGAEPVENTSTDLLDHIPFLQNQPIPSITTFQNPKPDLLVDGTYDDPDALLYFQCLEEWIQGQPQPQRQRQQQQQLNQWDDIDFAALPSTGHIGTSDATIAAQWGAGVVSVWPMGEEFHYAWPSDRQVFYPNHLHDQEKNMSLDSGRRKKCLTSERLVVDRRLDEALRRGDREVLFASRFVSNLGRQNLHLPSTASSKNPNEEMILYSPFLTVPIEYDDVLRTELEKIQYGL